MDGGQRVDVRSAMWTRSAILSYLKGENTLSWVLEAIEDAGQWDAARHFLRDLGAYGDPQRREELRRRLQAEAA